MRKILFLLLVSLFFTTFVFAGELQILNVSNSSTIPATIYAGDLVTINFDVENISGVGQGADNINVSIELNENDFEDLKVSENIGAISSRGSKTVSLRFKLKDSVFPGIYRIPVKLEYNSALNEILQFEEIDFTVTSCNTLKISDIDLSNFKPHINDTLKISVSIVNDCSVAARDVEIELNPITNSTLEPFIVSYDHLKIGDVLPGDSKDAKFSVQISDKVKTQTYVFSIDANCDTCTTTSNSFSFQVLGKPDLVFSNIEYSVENAPGNDSQIMQGSIFTLSVQLDNIGEEKAKAVSISVDFDDAIVGTSKSFLGNIDPDDSGAAIFNLTAASDASPGETPGTIIVTYTDELGVEQSFTEDYSLYINAQPPTSPIIWIIMLILIIVVLALIYFIIKFIFRQLALRKHSR